MDQKRPKTFLTNLLLILLFFYFFYCIYFILINDDVYQWDFKSQYTAAKVFSEGGNPYDSEAVKSISGTPWWYAYPPATLFFYRFFNLFDFKTAYNVFLLLKIFSIACLVIIWKNNFFQKKIGLEFYLFLLLSFNSAVFRDLSAGNINMFEELFVWIGFYYFIKSRYTVFCIFILLASSFKMTPIFFLVVLLATNDKNRFFYLFFSFCIFICYFLAQYLIFPKMLLAFFHGAYGTLGESGIYAPSTIELIKSILNTISLKTDFFIPPFLSLIIFGVFSSLILFLLRYIFKIFKNSELISMENGKKIILFVTCLAYASIHPRMKDYAYVLLIPAAFFIISTTTFKNTKTFLLFLPMLSSIDITLPGMHDFFFIFWNYFSLIIAYIFLFFYFFEINYLASLHSKKS